VAQCWPWVALRVDGLGPASDVPGQVMSTGRSSEIDMLGAGVVAGLGVSGLVVVWLSHAGRLTVSAAAARQLDPSPVWMVAGVLGAAAALVLLAGFCWWRLLP
jgi:hypothetical protein